jgi:hypothetical protein
MASVVRKNGLPNNVEFYKHSSIWYLKPTQDIVKFNVPSYQSNVIHIQGTHTSSVFSKLIQYIKVEAHFGDRRYSSYSFLTSALEGGEWSASRPGRALPPEKEPPVPVVQEAGWAPEPVWAQRGEEKSSASVGDRTPAVLY